MRPPVPPTCSVIIPAFNAASTLGKALTSLAAQTVAPLEVIVVDDGSTDETASIAIRGGAKVLPNPGRKGAGAARNAGAAAARGEILVFTDADCILPPTWIARIAETLQDQAIGAVGGGYAWAEDPGFIESFAFLELQRRRAHFPEFVQTAVTNNFAVRREVFERAGGFPECFAGATNEDVVLTWRVGCQAPLRWLKDNGVGHHFPPTPLAYLKQQFRFGRDTVVMNAELPEIRSVRTHQGRLLYLEALLSGLILLLLPFSRRWAARLWAVVLTINLPLLGDLFRAGGVSYLIRMLLFLPFRNANLVFCVFGGIASVLRTRLTTDGGTHATPVR